MTEPDLPPDFAWPARPGTDGGRRRRQPALLVRPRLAVAYERPEDGFLYLDHTGRQIMLEQIMPGRRWVTAPLERPFGRGINFQIRSTRSSRSAHP